MAVIEMGARITGVGELTSVGGGGNRLTKTKTDAANFTTINALNTTPINLMAAVAGQRTLLYVAMPQFTPTGTITGDPDLTFSYATGQTFDLDVNGMWAQTTEQANRYAWDADDAHNIPLGNGIGVSASEAISGAEDGATLVFHLWTIGV